MRKRNSYFINVTDTLIKGVSAKEFKELSKKWDKEPTEITVEELHGGYLHTEITKYTVEGIECGKVVARY